ncbi:MAG: hypothetical protein J6A62_01840 [Oscillospiraceae bacterium]|nr:hypothetical protein [Oscillospiraceae bacterium]
MIKKNNVRHGRPVVSSVPAFLETIAFLRGDKYEKKLTGPHSKNYNLCISYSLDNYTLKEMGCFFQAVGIEDSNKNEEEKE